MKKWMKTRILHRVSIVMALALFTLWIPLGFTDHNINYDFVESFDVLFDQLKEHYVLGEYRETDWDGLYETYMHGMKMAEEERDSYQAYKLLRQFADSFYDGHVSASFESKDEEYRQRYKEECAGMDYGFSIVRHADGRYVVVNVDQELPVYELGVRDGMEIVSLNGTPVEQLVNEASPWFFSFPIEEDEAFFKGLAVMSKLTGTLQLTYKDANKAEHTISLEEQGNYVGRFDQTYEIMMHNNQNGNLTYKMLDEDTAYFSLTDMLIDESIGRESSEREVEQDRSYEELHAQTKYLLDRMKEQGAKNLIIDMRGNGGGYAEVSMAVASCFLDQSVVFKEGIYEAGKKEYDVYEEIVCPAENEWGNGQVVILINHNTVSAAEIFLYFMRHQENVTVMGFTNSCGAAMSVEGANAPLFYMSYSGMLTLDENDEILVDPGMDRQCKIPVDIRIPLDDKAIQNLFVEKNDYVLQYALDYLQ